MGQAGRCDPGSCVAALRTSHERAEMRSAQRAEAGARTPPPPEQKNSPSRLRFRPPDRLTFRFRVRPPGWASTYSRPVLGARGKLRHGGGRAQGLGKRVPRILRKLRVAHAELAVRAVCSTKVDQGFAEPVALSSTRPTDVPLPRTRPSAGLRPTRAPCSAHGKRTAAAMAVQGPSAAKTPQFAGPELSTFPRVFQRAGENPVDDRTRSSSRSPTPARATRSWASVSRSRTVTVSSSSV
jgi:hypothetical protein